MLIFNECNDTIILDSIHTPILSEYMYVLDLNMMDYTLVPLLVLEEIVAPTIELRINNFNFKLPANWNILVVDDDTFQLDVIEISEVAGKEFKSLVYGQTESNFSTQTIHVSDYYPNHYNIGPALSKHQMLCHPISDNTWINVAPSDTYNKYLKDKVAGDLI